MQSTMTLTFGDQSENHVGMQKIGNLAPDGFNYEDILDTKKRFEELDCKCELIELNDYLPSNIQLLTKAYLLIIRKGVDKIIQEGSDKLKEEQETLSPDKQALMYGRVVNKSARYNLCFDNQDQEPDYSNGKGRIITYQKVPLLNKVRNKLHEFFGEKSKNLTIEANYYYDIEKCGIGYHGDGERRRVIGIRLGASLPLHYQWFQKNQAIGKKCELNLDHGDIYIMSEKTTGFDWKQKNIPTLRHAAGAKKFLVIKNKSNKKTKKTKK